MEESTNRVNLESLRELYTSDKCARTILDHFASIQRNCRTTNIDNLHQKLRFEGHGISRRDLIHTFKALEKCVFGVFVTGRKGWPSRFEWNYRSASVGKAAGGETDQVEDLTDEDLAEEDSQVLVRHTFHIRQDEIVALELPRDLSMHEANRLAEFIKTLPFE